jgi:cholesterol oxidase
MYETFSYPGIDVLCASGVGGGSHGWLGMLVEPPAGYWDNRHPELDPAGTCPCPPRNCLRI